MSKPSIDAFSRLLKPIRKLIVERGFGAPTNPQERTIPKILGGKNVLLISPTATGKTEAAILPVLNLLIGTPERAHGIKILYVTPLKALNRDLLGRLEWWCNNLDVKLAVRHGDTDTRERTRQARSPPDVLITTPETLQAILPGRLMRRHLSQVRWVIIDEVHEMADSKRGSQLSLALERLRWVTGREFQLIGLSATIGSPKKVAQFLVGTGREVEIVAVPVARLTRLKILYPKPESEDHALASSLFTRPEVAARLRVIRKFLENAKSVLLFTNTRAVSEVLASRFKVWDIDFPVSIHHGSLAKPSRIAAEQGLKSGTLRGLVATSSLELGIDIGRIDMVIQYMSPRQATRLIQRVGRSGHRIGRTARGVIITMDSDDTLEAMAIARMAMEERLEPVIVPEKPYDALAHQIVGLLMKKTKWRFSEIHDICKNAYPYAKLTEDDIRKVLTYMHQRFPRFAWVSFEDHLVIKPRRTKAMYEYYFENLSMIPAEKKYLVVDENSDGAIGVLDEAFVAEYGKPGVKFIIRGTPWKISNVMGDHLYVKANDDPTGAIPSWVGEEIPVPFMVAQEVGQIRGRIETEITAGAKLEDIAVQLTKDYPADRDTIIRAIADTAEQVHRRLPVPTNHRVLVEDWEDFVIIHCNFGSLANRALAQLIGHVLSDELGTGVAVQHDPYRIFVQTGGQVDADRITSLFGRLSQLSEGAVRDLLTKSAVRTGIFKRRMVHVARRFGALQRWVDFSRVSLSRLMKSFEGTAIFDEALKEVFTKDLNLERLVRILNEVRNSEITIIKLKVDGEASPIARVGIEKASMKTDLIQPERMRRILLESTRVRLLNETRTFVCCSCWDYLEMLRVKGLPAHPSCPRCSSRRLGVLRVEERQVLPLVDKDEGEKLTKAEAKIQRKAVKTAALVERFGLPAVVVLCGRGLRVNDAEQVLKQEKTISDTLFDLIIEAERNALKRRFW